MLNLPVPAVPAPFCSPFTGTDHGAQRGFVGHDFMKLQRPQQLQGFAPMPCARAAADAGAEGDHVLMASPVGRDENYGES